MLSRGSAKKVTIYLNQNTRAHLEPLWSAILGFLRHKQVAGATLVRADAGFGMHGQLHDSASEYTAQDAPVLIEFIEAPQRVEELLPMLYDMVSDGLITVQDLTVVKAVSRSAELRARQTESTARRVETKSAKLVRIYLGESDKCNGECLYEAIVNKLRMMNFSGATVFRGILGYGVKGHTHRMGPLRLAHDLPVMISIVETPERAEELIRVAAAMMEDGLIVASDVQLHQMVRELPESPKQTV